MMRAAAFVVFVAVVIGSCSRSEATTACARGGCAANEWCTFTPGLCGKGKTPGACRARPSACADAYAPICGCDGHVYPNECAAHAAGVDLDAYGRCREPAAPDWAACGPRFCDARTSYCEIVLSDVFELPTDYTCKPLPPSCVGARTCDCFPKETRCVSFCGPMDNAGMPGFHLTCRS